MSCDKTSLVRLLFDLLRVNGIASVSLFWVVVTLVVLTKLTVEVLR